MAQVLVILAMSVVPLGSLRLRPTGEWTRYEWFAIGALVIISAPLPMWPGFRVCTVVLYSILGQIMINRVWSRKKSRLADLLSVDQSAMSCRASILNCFLESPSSYLSWVFFFSRAYSPSECEHNAVVLRRLSRLLDRQSREVLRPILDRFEGGRYSIQGCAFTFGDYRRYHDILFRLGSAGETS